MWESVIQKDTEKNIKKIKMKGQGSVHLFNYSRPSCPSLASWLAGNDGLNAPQFHVIGEGVWARLLPCLLALP